MRRRPKRGRDQGDLNPLPPFVDITVATIMALLLLTSLHALNSMKAEVYDEITRRQTALRGSVQAAFPEQWRKGAIADSVDNEEQRFTFTDRVLFPSSEATLNPQGKVLLQRFGAILRQHQDDLDVIRVEGHTDEQPIHSRFYSNWELSTARACAVVHVLVDQDFGVCLRPELVNAAGYAEFHPVAKGHSEAAWHLNRRIEVAIRYSPARIERQLEGSGEGGV